MKTLYDLLDVQPDANSEQLRKSFREAAKANHPDLHAGDPAAAARFTRIVEAYDILRDAEQRALYDRMLAFERRPKPLHSKVRHAVSGATRYIVSDAIAAVGLAIVMVGAYTLFKHMTETSVEEAVAITQMAPAVAVVPPVGFVVSATHDRGASEADAVSGHAGLRTITDHSGTGDGMEPPDRTKPAEVSAHEKPDSELKPSASNLSISNNKPDIRIPNAYANDTKPSEMKIPGRPQTAPKRQAASRSPLEQASLENRSPSGCAASQPCSGGIAPLFGVGF
jgi:curved DNA-binding protein CbpA